MGKGLWLSLVRLEQGGCGDIVMLIRDKDRAEELWRNDYGYLW